MKAERKVKVVALRPHDQSLLLLLDNNGFLDDFQTLVTHYSSKEYRICENLICSVGLDFGFEEKTGVGLRIVGKGNSRTEETIFCSEVLKL